MSTMVAQRPVLTFEEAMQKALQKKAVSQKLPSKYFVEVFLRTKFEGQSHYQSTFQAPTPEKANERDARAGLPAGPQDMATPPTRKKVPFVGESTTKSTYVAHPISPDSRPVSASNKKAGSGSLRFQSLPFQGSSHYRDTFTAPSPGNQRTQPAGSPNIRGPVSPPSIPFQGSSHSKDTFKPPPPEAYGVGMAKPESAHNQGSGPDSPFRPSIPFEGRTTHQETYVPHQLPEQHPGRKVPVTDPVAQRLFPDDRDFSTSTGQAYQQPKPEPVQVSIDSVGRLRVILDRSAKVQDLHDAIAKETMIPIEVQSLVRKQDGMPLTDKSQLLVDSLDWQSGEEVTLLPKAPEQ